MSTYTSEAKETAASSSMSSDEKTIQTFNGQDTDKVEFSNVKDQNRSVEKLEQKSGSEDERISEANAAPAPPNPFANIPNGGLLAWSQVLGSFFLFMNSWGIVNTFGVYQTFYSTDLLSSKSSSDISWIGSIQACLLLVVGVATGPMYDKGYFRELISVGTLMTVGGMMMTSLCKEYWQVILAQAFCVGIGCGCLFVPSVAIVATYFNTKKALAMGIAAAGSSIGGVLYPIIFHKLQPHIGFGWSTRTIAFIMLGTLSVSMTVMRSRVNRKTAMAGRALYDLSALREPPFVIFTLTMFFGFMCLYYPFYYISEFALTKPGVDPSLSFYLLSILNAASTFGRIVPNHLADKIGPLNVLCPAVIISGCLAFTWLGIENTASFVAFAILYGFASGGFVSLPPTVVVTLSPNLSVVGARMGMCFATAGLGVLMGTPVAGALVTRYGFDAGTIFCAVMVCFGGCLGGLARVTKTGLKLRAVA